MVDAVIFGSVGGFTALATAAVFDRVGATSRYDGVFFVGGAALAIGVHWVFQRLE